MKGWKLLLANTILPALYLWLGRKGFDIDPATQDAIFIVLMSLVNVVLRWFTTTPMFHAAPAPVVVAQTPAGPVLAIPQPAGPAVIAAPETRNTITLEAKPVATRVQTPAFMEAVRLEPTAPG